MATALSDEMHTSELRIVPANEAPFDDVEAVFGTKGDPAHCWCQWYKIPGKDWRAIGDESLHDRLAAQLSASPTAPGLLAYDGETPVGWCALEPRPAYPRLLQSTIVGATPETDLDDPTVWAVTCFVVPRAYRKRGVGKALAEAAVEFAREHGARVLEAYAIDHLARPGVPAADLFHGTVTMFLHAGFAEVARPKPDRAVMQLRFDDAGARRGD
jgi:GNAT superfamily N-acetyltransferase